MKKSTAICLVIICLFSLLTKIAIGQSQSSKIIELSVYSTGLKKSDITYQPTEIFSAQYTNQVKLKPFFLQFGISYTNQYRTEALTKDIFYRGNRSQRFTFSFIPLYKIAKYRSHSFTIGAGPSFSYQRNLEAYNVTGYFDKNGSLESITLDKKLSNEWIAGLQLKAFYSYSLNSHFNLSLQGLLISNISSTKPIMTIPTHFNCIGIAFGYVL